jgi:hypothetical protein
VGGKSSKFLALADLRRSTRTHPLSLIEAISRPKTHTQTQANMAGINLAVTQDGETYNKLQRPGDYLTATTAPRPPRPLRPPIADTSVAASASKRKYEQPDSASQRKRARPATRPATESTLPGPYANRKRSRDIDCGMRTMLPCSDEEEALSDVSLGDALSYLRSVRSEAAGIPHLLVVDTATHYDDDGDSNCNIFYEEGAWIAVEKEHVADHPSGESPVDAADPNPQNRYYQLLLKRFEVLRGQLATAEIETAVHEGPSPRKNDPPQESKRTWAETIEKEYPSLKLMAHMGDRTLYNCLAHCTRALDSPNPISPQVSCWTWALLASVGEFGTLHHWKISCIRDLAQRAGLLGECLRKHKQRRVCGGGSPAAGNFERGDVSAATEKEEDHRKCEFNQRGTSSGEGAATNHLGNSMDPAEATQGENGSSTPESSRDVDESDAEMSMSDEDDEDAWDGPGFGGLEQARARLLAQLGDRLVQTTVPSSDSVRASESSAHSPRSDNGNRRNTQNASAPVDDGAIAGCADMATAGVAEVVDVNTMATIDMVLTVVAECFGQKDLLAYRQRW